MDQRGWRLVVSGPSRLSLTQKKRKIWVLKESPDRGSLVGTDSLKARAVDTCAANRQRLFNAFSVVLRLAHVLTTKQRACL